MAEGNWDTKKIAGYGAIFGASAMIIALGANGRLFTAPVIANLNSVIFLALLIAGIFAAASGLRNYWVHPNAPTVKWKTGRIALYGAGVGLVLGVLTMLQTGLPSGLDSATQAGLVIGRIAGSLGWGAGLAAIFSAIRNLIARPRIPAPKAD